MSCLLQLVALRCFVLCCYKTRIGQKHNIVLAKAANRGGGGGVLRQHCESKTGGTIASPRPGELLRTWESAASLDEPNWGRMRHGRTDKIGWLGWF